MVWSPHYPTSIGYTKVATLPLERHYEKAGNFTQRSLTMPGQVTTDGREQRALRCQADRRTYLVITDVPILPSKQEGSPIHGKGKAGKRTQTTAAQVIADACREQYHNSLSGSRKKPRCSDPRVPDTLEYFFAC
jgi:hypothetical protein